ncbi:MAG: MBOAT family protein [Synechococcales bacterium]|nr:MBOAT family protein [Synechococcales bacterium]
MTLLSITYGIFLLSILGIYWTQEERSLRLFILLVASLVFYASLQIQYVPLLILMALVTFYMGLAIGSPLDWRIPDEQWQFAQQDWNRRRLHLLWVGVILNILLLVGFRYLPFLLSSTGTLLNLPIAQTSADWIGARLLVPLGLSYFVFECIAYLVDVYRGAPATPSLLEFSTYKLFFPKLLSGPITRFHHLDSQLQAMRSPRFDQVVDGLWLIACGAVKKLMLADHLATLVNLSFDNLERAGSGDLWLATFAYGLQLYLDFSGYVDVARGSATLLGFELPQNFNFPYFATNLADFWRRWHMTLGDWLRNYLYFPLGGSRKGLARTCLNLIIVMLVAGFWHGAGLGFLIWGAIHGVGLAVHRLMEFFSQKIPALAKSWHSVAGVIFAWGLTQLTVFFSWIFFRLPDPRDFGLVLRHLWGHSGDVQFAQKIYLETLQIDRAHLAWLLWGIVGGMGLIYAVRRGMKLQFNWHLKVLLVPVLLYLAWLLAPSETLPYIYFDF